MAAPTEYAKCEHRFETDEDVIYFYGDVANTQRRPDDVTPSMLRDEVKAVKSDRIKLRLNSYGGDPLAGFAMMTILRESGKEIDTVNDGVVASAMTLPFMVGQTRRMSKGSRLMIHEARGFVSGTADQIEEDSGQYVEQLRETNRAAAELYAEKTGLPLEDVESRMARETWMTASRAVATGFATEASNSRMVMCATQADLSRFGYDLIPDDIPATQPNKKLDSIITELTDFRRSVYG